MEGNESLYIEELKGVNRRLDRLETSMKELTELIIQHNTLRNRVDNHEITLKEQDESLEKAWKHIRDLEAHPQRQKAAMVDQVLKWVLAGGGIIATGYVVSLLQKLAA
jgi:aryl-alcohol dehydrogenase-like predicted oxidoreductase